MTKYTSLELSKKLYKNGCELESEKSWFHHELMKTTTAKRKQKDFIKEYGKEYKDKDYKIYPAYDLLWDVCIKHKDDFFGDLEIYFPMKYNTNPFSVALLVSTLQQNKKQEAEDYIWEHCKFNPKNKK